MDEHKPDERAIFNIARRLQTPEDRRTYLSQVCGNDAGLQERVTDLLRGFEQAEDFLEPSPAGVVATMDVHSAVDGVAATIGPYKLREQIGEGGMGVVYVAEQSEPVRRKVALKVIKPGMASKEVVARFEAERQAVAMMDHPNIARVYDGGITESGQPYFVMELVQGLPITEYCDQQRLSTEDRLKLFVTVCRAVQHAHQRGVIHRDLKPSNIIVAEIDATSVPKVIDFGVAKAIGQTLTEETVYTQFSQMVGTPLYMSPEQTGLGVVDVDTRSDVYSLGVLLYELLTGNTPFDRDRLKTAGFDELRRIIREDEPMRPSAMVSTLKAGALSTISERRCADPRKLQDSLRGELDWLVMKALDKDRNRRYESASDFAADAQRYLNGDPLEACPPSVVYRLRKTAARHKAAFTTVGLVTLALLVGIVATSWQAWRATQATSRAESNLQLANQNSERAEQERSKATQNFRRARDTVNQFLTTVDENQLLQNPEMQPLRNELVVLAREYYQQFINDASDDPALKADLADAYLRLGDIAWALGDHEVGDTAHQQAVTIRKQLAEGNPEDENFQHDLATTLLAVSQIGHSGQLINLRDTLEAATPLSKPVHRYTLAKACLELAGALLRSYSGETGDTNERDEAFASAQRAEEIFQRLRQEEPANVGYQFGLAEALALTARHHSMAGKHDQAKELRQRSRTLLEKFAADDSADIAVRERLGEAYVSLGEHLKAIEVYRGLMAEHPTVVQYQEPLIAQYRAAAQDMGATRVSDEKGLSYLQSAVDIARDLSDRYPASKQQKGNLGVTLAGLGSAQARRGHLDEAIDSLESAVAALTTVKPYLIGVLGDAYSDLSSANEAVGNLQAAIESQQHNLEINRELRERYPKNLRFVSGGAGNLLELAALLRQTGKPEEALAQTRAAVALLEQALASGTPDAPTMNILRVRMGLREGYRESGNYLRQLGRTAEAADAFRQAIAAEAEALRGAPGVLFLRLPNRLYDEWLEMERITDDDNNVDSVLREELATWHQLELEPTSQFKWSHLIRQLEVHLRLAEWLLHNNRHAEAAESYKAASSLLDSRVGNPHSGGSALAVAVCLHVCGGHETSGVVANEFRNELLEAVSSRVQPALERTRQQTRDSPRDGGGWRWDTWSELALAYYRPLQWKGAEADAQEAIELAADRLQPLQKMAPLLLLAGKHDDYQSLCQDLLNELDEKHGDALTRTLHLCLLDPQPADSAALLQAARRAAEVTGDKHLFHVALYRNGQFDQAIDGLANDLKSTIHSRSIVELHLAIAHKLSGDQDAAQTWFAEADRHRNSVWRPEEKVTFAALHQQVTKLLDQSSETEGN